MKDLSRWQFRLLMDLIDKYGSFISYEQAHGIKQGTFGSFISPKRGYLKYIQSREGWRVTKAALDARRSYLLADISRLNPGRPLTHYFDAAAYGLEPPERKPKPKRAAPKSKRLHIVAA